MKKYKVIKEVEDGPSIGTEGDVIDGTFFYKDSNCVIHCIDIDSNNLEEAKELL